MLATMIPAAFASDLDGHWSKNFIEYLDDEGIINPSATTGKYEPERKVTRAEFMRYVNRAFHFTEKVSISYSDVQSNSWYYDTVRIAEKYGYINGTGNGRMNPEGYVTREQAAVILGRLYKADPGNVKPANLSFKDKAKVATWSAGYVKAAVDKGIITGYKDNTFKPTKVITRAELAKILQRTFDRGGNVVIPSFAVGRTQELLYFIREIKEKNLITGHGCFPVYIDSPLAIEATRIFKDTDPDCFDEQTRALLEQGIDPIGVPGLRVTVTSDESRMINTDRTPKVILSASGMCEAGRIRHHLKHNLWRPECTILFVGYQAVGTLGRTLIEGATTVKLFGEPIEVQAEICQLTGMSGHADRDGLLRWVNAFTEKPKRVFVMHGEDEVENIFVDTLTGQGFTACAPYNGAQWAIGAEGAVCLQEGTKVRIEHKVSEGQNRAATVFQRLVSAGKRLLRVIEHNEGGANKDLAKFADQINALCDKWDN